MFLLLNRKDALNWIKKHEPKYYKESGIEAAVRDGILLTLPGRSKELEPLYLSKLEYNSFGYEPLQIDNIIRLTDEYMEYYHLASRYKVFYHRIDRYNPDKKPTSFFLLVNDECLKYSEL